MAYTSNLPGFYKKSPAERLEIVCRLANLSAEDATLISTYGSLQPEVANRMIENVIGTMPLPLGIAVNFLINGKDYLIPMALEEPSVIAAASHAAKLCRATGGFNAASASQIMIGQIQLLDVPFIGEAKRNISAHKTELINLANAQDPMLVKAGGGAKDIEVRVVKTGARKFVVVHLLVDCRDAMGANAINTMAEAVAPLLESITKGKVCLRIISNLAVYRLARASVLYSKEIIGGEGVVDKIISAYKFAVADVFRAATHNKGIMNGISAVAIATGNDFRALEAGAHSYASYRKKSYKPLTKWWKTKNGDLAGEIELPIAVGLIGGATAVHPVAKINLKILGVKSAAELAEVMAAVGLAQNFAALRALATEGIQRGHMELHARNLAITAGAMADEIDLIVNRLVADRKIRLDRAKEILAELRGER